MARNLSAQVDQATAQDFRVPDYLVEVFDVVSTFGTPGEVRIGAIVSGGGLGLSRDFSNEFESLTFTERGSNTLDGTLGATSIRAVVVDEKGLFDPVDGAEKRWLQPGNVVRVREGFEGIDQSLWTYTFTGTIVGRAGSDGQDREGNAVLDLAIEDRMAGFLKLTTTSASFVQGTSFNFMMRELAQISMGMDFSEFSFDEVGAQTSNQAFTQFVQESPIVSIANILFTLGFVPRFDGEGRLGIRPLTVDAPNRRTYTDDNVFQRFARPYNPLANVNRVEVVGLASEMTRVFQTSGVVATAGLTQGFFSGDSSIRVPFSDDGTILVNNPRLRVLSSIQGALIPFGSSEDLEIVVTDTDPDLGSIQGATEGRIEIEGAFYAPLVTVLFASRLAASFIPDTFAGFGGGSTIPVGRIIEGFASIATTTILATIGKGEYEVVGEPYEYVFEELRGVAEIANLAPEDRRPVTIENHLIDTDEAVDAAALRELRLARKRGNAFQLTMRHDLRLEADDKFSRFEGNRSYIIAQISRTVSRGATGFATLEIFETTADVNP